MRKIFETQVDTLRASVTEIMNSAADNRDDLLIKSFSEFQGALETGIVEEYGPEPEPLAKGLNYIGRFTADVDRLSQTIDMIKTGQPLAKGLEGEPIPESIVPLLDDLRTHGIVVLRTMVNDSSELLDDESAERVADRAGQLAKIETDNGEILVKTELPTNYREFLTDPLDLLIGNADLARSFTDRASEIAEDLLKSDMLPADFIDEYPELFVVDDGLGKAFPPKKKAAADDDPEPDPNDAGEGSEQDPNDANAVDPNADPNAGGGAASTDITDDTPQDPLEMGIRLATMIVVILSSLAQGGQANGPVDGSSMGDPNDPNNVGLQRSIPMADVPLAKIMAGDVAVDPSVADALEERVTLLAEVETLRPLTKKFADQEADLRKLQEAVERLGKQSGAPTSVLRAMPVSKSADSVPGMKTAEDLASEVTELAKRDPQGDSAARLLITQVHGQGGRPFNPMES